MLESLNCTLLKLFSIFLFVLSRYKFHIHYTFHASNNSIIRFESISPLYTSISLLIESKENILIQYGTWLG